MQFSFQLIVALAFPFFITGQRINVKELKCLVCKRVVEEMEKAVDKVDPKKRVEVGTYRLDHKGDQSQRTVELRKSEVYLTELMEKICNKMDDYVRARSKATGQLHVIPLITEDGQMNSLIGELDIIQDSDLNKSLKFYCENILEENEDGFIKTFANMSENLDITLCSNVAGLCNEKVQDEYKFEDSHEEL
ncbi:protein seele [Cimex lectularius]|uniref:DUF3456 domain-containing protein n=1 Tax=Cimex lectularius TaxID=79782 RepID=A0A8I6SMZ5_CIMLE|nr:protein seele [Cimex lectularius]XP_024085105.1 protein seele [Cimex lectularius]